MSDDKNEEKEIIKLTQNEMVEIIQPPLRYGVKPTCTPEWTDEFCGYIRDGLSGVDACKVMGISTVSISRWRARGLNRKYMMEKAEEEGIELQEDLFEDWYLYFYQEYERSIPMRKLALLDRIMEASKDKRFWTAAAWYLERVHPEEFAKRVTVKKEDWRTEVLELIKNEIVDFKLVAEKVGDEDARRLFERAGKRIPGEISSGENN